MAVFNEPTQWDHELGNNADVRTLPDDTGATTGVASLQKLFQQINQTPLSAGGVAPERLDFNSLFKVLGDSVFYAMNGGLASYNASYDYAVGRFVVYNNTLYKCIQANGASSTVVAPDSVSPVGTDYWLDIENQHDDSTSLIPNQMIISLVPLTDANLHLLDGALLSGSGTYADFVDDIIAKYTANPNASCWTTEVNWQSSVSTYGVCGKYVVDTVNNTVRIPKVTGFIEGTNTASELGNLTEAGAPNITGHVERGGSSVTEFALYTSSSGALGLDLKSLRGINGVTTTINGSNTLNFDASQSNSIYGNSNTVQPQSIKVYYYVVVGTVSKTQIQIDIDNVMADLALKADKDFTNIDNSAKIAIAHNAMPSATVYDNLTLGSSGDSYTAPADGFFCLAKNGDAGKHVTAYVNGTSASDSIRAYRSDVDASAGFASLNIPVLKGDVVTYTYDVTGATQYFRFIYAVGSESEQ